MRRRLKHLALFLLLGAAINYSLAMGFIWFGPLRKSELTGFTFHGASVWRIENIGMTRIICWPMEAQRSPFEPGEPPTWSRLNRLPRPFMSYEEWHALPETSRQDDAAAGWPLRSVSYEFDQTALPHGAGEFIIQSGIQLPPKQVIYPFGERLYPRAIPLRIIPLGFAFNTLLFASLAAMLWYTPPTIRQIRRTRGNRCLKCGYAREGLATGATCPECGAPNPA